MLWDLIRDFFVQYVFGGVNSNDELFSTYIGNYYYTEDLTYEVGYLQGSQDKLSLSLGDYLSTTATIIAITIIVALCCLFVYKIIKLIGGLIR